MLPCLVLVRAVALGHQRLGDRINVTAWFNLYIVFLLFNILETKVVFPLLEGPLTSILKGHLSHKSISHILMYSSTLLMYLLRSSNDSNRNRNQLS